MILRFKRDSLDRNCAELVTVAPQRRANEAPLEVVGADGLEVPVNQHGVTRADEVDVGRSGSK